MKMISKATLVIVITALSACASTQETVHPTEAGLQSKTAVVLGYKPEEVKIANMRSDNSYTYYAAETAKGKYDCQILYGGIIVVGYLGAPVSPTCTKQ